MNDLEIHKLSYSAGRLLVAIGNKIYEYEVSPYIVNKFQTLLKYNKGRALALLRGNEVAKPDPGEKMVTWKGMNYG